MTYINDFSFMRGDPKPHKREPWYYRHALKLLGLVILILGFLTYFQFTSPFFVEHAEAQETVDAREIVEDFEGQTRMMCENWLAKHPAI